MTTPSRPCRSTLYFFYAEPELAVDCFYAGGKKTRQKRKNLRQTECLFAHQALINLLRPAVEENIRRDCALRPSCVSLQCLCCRSEFSAEGDGGGRVRRRAEGAEERDDEELTERGADRDGELWSHQKIQKIHRLPD